MALAPWKESYDQSRQHIKKQRHYFANKGPSSQSYGFSSSQCMDVSVGLKRKLSAEELMLLNCGVGEDSWVLWPARRSNQSILKKIGPEYSLEGLMRKLKLQYFGHLMQRADSLEKDWCWERLKAGGEGYDRGWGGWMASPTQWTWVWASSMSWWRTGKPGVHGVAMSRTQLISWTEAGGWSSPLPECKMLSRPFW